MTFNFLVSPRRQNNINSFFFFLVWHLNVHHILFKRQGSLGRPHSTTHVQNNTYYFSLAQLIQDFCRNKLSLGATATHRTTHFPLTWHFSLHSELSSSHVSWHKLEIDNRNLFNICQLKNTLLYFDYFTPDWPIISLALKGPDLRAGNDGFPHVGKEWRYVTNPIFYYVFLFLL